MTLEEAIGKRDGAAALATLEQDPGQCEKATSAGVSMLMWALYHELPEVASAIRAKRPAVTFFEAAAMGELAAVREAVASEPALVDGYAPDGFTVLGLAIFFRQPAVARYLIEAGADVNLPARNARKVAPIHAACARLDLEILRLLLARGANPDAAQEGGFTPLRQAVSTGNAELEAILRGAGAIAG